METLKRRQILAAAPSSLQSRRIHRLRLRARRESRRCLPGSASNAGESGREELFRLQRTVSFVTVPVTVKDNEGKLVDGLLQSDFSIYEDGAKQQIKLFTSDPFPLSAALIIDQGMSDLTLKKVNQTFSALGGSFGPFDEVSVFTYGNTVNQRSDFGNATRMEIALQRIKDERGENPSAPVVGGPFGAGPVTNSKPIPGGKLVITPEQESHVLNDAILAAAQNLAHRPRQNRKIIFVISDGQELGSRASYAQVLKVLLTDEIAVYAIGVDSAAMPLYNKIEKARIPGLRIQQHPSAIHQRHRRRRAERVLQGVHRKRLSAHHHGSSQPVHAGL